MFNKLTQRIIIPSAAALLGASVVIATRVASISFFGNKSTDTTAATPFENRLFSFDQDPLTGGITNFTDIGSITLDGTTINTDGLAINKSNQLFSFQLTNNNTTSRLVTLDKTNATAATNNSVILNNREIRGAVVDFDQTILALDSLNDQLLRINSTTGQIQGTPINLQLNNNPFNLSNVADIAVRLDNFDGKNISKTVFVSDRTNIYSLNLASGELILEHNAPNVGMVGITFSNQAESDASLFAFDVFNRNNPPNNKDDLYKFDTDNNFDETVLARDILPDYNAGRGDLAAPVNVEIPETSGVAGVLLFGAGLLWRGVRNNNR